MRRTRLMILFLCAALLTSCASPRAKYDAALVDYRIQQSMKGIPVDDANGVMKPLPNTSGPPPASSGPSAGDVVGALLLTPLLIPITMLESYPWYRGAHCYSYTYKDQYHVKCY
jgi:hypothetical protein